MTPLSQQTWTRSPTSAFAVVDETGRVVAEAFDEETLSALVRLPGLLAAEEPGPVQEGPPTFGCPAGPEGHHAWTLGSPYRCGFCPATWPKQRTPAELLAEALWHAERALHLAQRGGANGVVVANLQTGRHLLEAAKREAEARGEGTRP